MMRLDKFLSTVTKRSRTEIKIDLKRAKVTVNDKIIKKPEFKIDEIKDIITYENEILKYEEFVYYILNKPAGVISATTDKMHETVIDLIKEDRKNLLPVGRLDKDTEGMLIITNDGNLIHDLMSPKKHIDKKYYAKIDGVVTEEDVKAFFDGLDIGDTKLTLKAELKILESGDISEIEVTISEGRYHQVKRMFEAVDKEVIYLKRVAIGNYKLDDNLLIGEYKKISKEELIEKIM